MKQINPRPGGNPPIECDASGALCDAARPEEAKTSSARLIARVFACKCYAEVQLRAVLIDPAAHFHGYGA